MKAAVKQLATRLGGRVVQPEPAEPAQQEASMAFEDGRFNVDVKVEFTKADGTIISRRHAEILDMSYETLVAVQRVLVGIENQLQQFGEQRAAAHVERTKGRGK